MASLMKLLNSNISLWNYHLGERKWPCFSNTRDSDIETQQRKPFLISPDGTFSYKFLPRTLRSIDRSMDGRTDGRTDRQTDRQIDR